jgi:hypothetical protein
MARSAVWTIILLFGCSSGPPPGESHSTPPDARHEADVCTECNDVADEDRNPRDTAEDHWVDIDSDDALLQDRVPEDLPETAADGEDADPDLLPDAAEVIQPDTQSCECDPPTVSLTVNGIPAEMNGSLPYLANDGEWRDFRLSLPTHGFRWDVHYDCPCGCALLQPVTAVSSVSAGDVLAGESLSHLFEQAAGRLEWLVPAEYALGAGTDVLLSATVEDRCGQIAEPADLTVEVHPMTRDLHPFLPQDPWLIVWKRDHRAIQLAADGAGMVVQSSPGANGRFDFLEDLWLLGLGTEVPLDDFAVFDCGVVQGGNECIAWRILEAVRAKSYQFFYKAADGTDTGQSADIVFFIQDEDDAPDPTTFQYETLTGLETERRFSMIGLGGGDLGQSLLGLSESLDLRNIGNENNARSGFGCLTTSLFRYLLGAMGNDPGLYSLASMILGDVVPGLGGLPLGLHPEDVLVLDLTIPLNALSLEAQRRRNAYDFMVEGLGLGLAALLVHEIGHSVGLVPYGPPPHGLFGGEKLASFVENPAGCTGPHTDTKGFNLMQAGPGSGNGFQVSLDMLTSSIGFNELNESYLRGRLILLP